MSHMAITRRAFTYSAATALLAITKPRFISAAPLSNATQDLDLSTGWDLYAEGELTQRAVTFPHSPIALSWHQWQPASWEKVWVYRREVTLPNLSRERLFLSVERALTNAQIKVNGRPVGSHEGGFTPFECEITDAVRAGTNQIEIQLDSRWLNVPPSGSPKGVGSVDYYLPGGINGHITLRRQPQTAITDLWTHTKEVLSDSPSLEVLVSLDADAANDAIVAVKLFDGSNLIRSERQPQKLSSGIQTVTLAMKSLRGIKLWSPDTPTLYRLETSLLIKGKTVHTKSIRLGFRDARFERDGFYLNGKKTRIFGLNRHELFPYVGFAASERAMRRDADYLRNVLNCNMVRCSHYPQSPAFLDACDELGLMVWEEIPGWQYLGDAAWKDVALRNVEEMIRRDRNHPSILIWGTRINESANDPALYLRTHDLAKQLDPTRPTSGSMTPSSRSDWKEHWHEDVFAFDDYHAASDGSVGIDPALPGVPYMLAEAVGQYSYGTAKNFLRRYRRAGIPEEQNAQALLHAQAHDRAARDPRNSGVIAWCAYDYASPMNAYNGVKCPGVVDTFRIPKLGASFYMAQVDPTKRVVLEPSFYWDARLHARAGPAAIFSNCNELRIFLNDQHHATLQPDTTNYPKTVYPPFVTDLPWKQVGTSVLRIDGYIREKQVVSRSFTGDHTHDRLWVTADDAAIAGDGIDSTRVSFGVQDEFGNTRPVAHGAITVTLKGPGKIVGDTTFDLTDSGAVGAVWIRGVPGQHGSVQLTVSHPTFESKSVVVSML
ncbi:MAG TPA: glycoside hydrolase family 2 TIM barrel-domain containing protein [Bryobacteraceae bacterium]